MMKRLYILLVLFCLPVLCVASDSVLRHELAQKAIKAGWQSIDKKPDVLAPAKHLDTALMHFYHAIILEQASGPAWFAVGYAYSLKQNPDEALAAYKTSLQYQPDYPSTHMNIGIILLSKGDMQASLSALLKARGLAPQTSRIHSNLARWYLINKQVDKAQQSLKLAYKYKKPGDEAFLKRLSSFVQQAKDAKQ